jgi:hypothetical protein
MGCLSRLYCSSSSSLLLYALIVQVFAGVRPASIHRPHRRQAEEPGDAEEPEVQEANQEAPRTRNFLKNLFRLALVIGGIIVGGSAGLRVATTAGWLPIFKLLFSCATSGMGLAVGTLVGMLAE